MTATPTTGPLDWNSPIAPVADGASPGKIRESARQFEALLIGQIMRSMCESSGGWLGSGEDGSGASMTEFAEQQMAQVLSANGGFGLATLIEQGVSRGGQPQKPENAKEPLSGGNGAPGAI